jgi:hypothetical protein
MLTYRFDNLRPASNMASGPPAAADNMLAAWFMVELLIKSRHSINPARRNTGPLAKSKQNILRQIPVTVLDLL